MSVSSAQSILPTRADVTRNLEDAATRKKHPSAPTQPTQPPRGTHPALRTIDSRHVTCATNRIGANLLMVRSCRLVL
ncbi:hypothetical protein PBY51_010960 [Eleginops maclovinus]|uniref:Uncharacterized protein n=1 Tax=Eleginops maclovinus TaxID=56733 RepID=A0AAN7X8U6_ELEMC|nr:hypothetical protein PBY51_010960 [Eleginops maclovinus]